MFRTHISNNFLKVDKFITAKTQWELDKKIKNQKDRWKVQEKKAREQIKFDKMKEKAISDTGAALNLINEYKSLLMSSLNEKHKINWKKLYSTDKFKGNKPLLNSFMEIVEVPKEEKFFEFFFSTKKKTRLGKEYEAAKKYNDALNEYIINREKFIQKQNQHNKSIDRFQKGYEDTIPAFVERYFFTIIEKSEYPKGFTKKYDIQYQADSKTLIIDFDMPHPEKIPNIIEYKFIQTRKEVTKKLMTKKEFNDYYEDVLYQITLKTVYECFASDYANTVEMIVFNGWVHGTDTSTGQDFHSCIMSLQVTSEEFLSLNLDKVIPIDCFRNLKGLNASSLFQLAPVRPILNIDRIDKRFVESKDVLAEINSIPNLADMPWEDFEHLVRGLFAKYFSSVGAEVKVTRTSRDGGIDAVAIDPDPIRGGKFIIQAKRYNHVVPVSAVRELYGVMPDEGAVKGILVTTSYYGKDSREFVKDKPLTLLDGSNLIQMFNDYGYNVRIELKNKAN
ncbi:restriction endonuclease [Evansella sp. AB-rgal1]|uniref:restriction endonuclease n=1 Tax=Evansella sp. AB-rgal1 TaxID=3242696 RepID=UPI00359E0D75